MKSSGLDAGYSVWVTGTRQTTHTKHWRWCIFESGPFLALASLPTVVGEGFLAGFQMYGSSSSYNKSTEARHLMCNFAALPGLSYCEMKRPNDVARRRLPSWTNE